MKNGKSNDTCDKKREGRGGERKSLKRQLPEDEAVGVRIRKVQCRGSQLHILLPGLGELGLQFRQVLPGRLHLGRKAQDFRLQSYSVFCGPECRTPFTQSAQVKAQIHHVLHEPLHSCFHGKGELTETQLRLRHHQVMKVPQKHRPEPSHLRLELVKSLRGGPELWQ